MRRRVGDTFVHLSQEEATIKETKDLREVLKDFVQISECLEAIEFIAANTSILSFEAQKILDEEIAKREKGDPLRDIFEHQKRLISALKKLIESLKPKISSHS